MAINKNAQIRYLVLDGCLRDRPMSWAELLKAVNNKLSEDMDTTIGKTQLFKDLKALEFGVYKAPIEMKKEGRTTYYFYADKSYSIQQAPMTTSDTNQLKATLQMLSRFKGLAEMAFLNEVIPMLQQKLNLITSEKEVMCFEENPDYTGIKYLTTLFNAITHKRVLHIRYRDFNAPLPYDMVFHPHYLKQYNNRWNLLGYNETKEKHYWNLALDRILDIEENLGVFYKKSETDDWEGYFDDIIGVTKVAGEIETVKLWFDSRQAPYILSKPLHHTQKWKNEEGDGLYITIKVIPNYELEKLILSFGETVKVLEPESLRERIIARITGARKLYNR